MIERPKDLVKIEISIEFNYSIFNKLEIDLGHINKDSRSNYTVEQILGMVESMVSGKYLAPSDTKEFEEESCSYFVRTSDVDGEDYKLVFCICSDKQETIGVITFFRI